MSHIIWCKHTLITYSWHSGIHTKSNLTVTEHSPIVIWLEIPNELLTWMLNKDIHYDVCLHAPKHLIRIYMLWHGGFGSSGSICVVSNLPEISFFFVFFPSLIEPFLFINMLYAFVLPVNVYLNIEPHCVLGKLLAFLFWCIPTSCSNTSLNNLFRAFRQSLHFIRSTTTAKDQLWTHAERFTPLSWSTKNELWAESDQFLPIEAFTWGIFILVGRLFWLSWVQY